MEQVHMTYGKEQRYCTKNVQFCHITFTGKEKDEETGYSYFGARYYDSDLSGLFLSVDPMADKYPRISPYAYCAWNPVKLVDPDGRELILICTAECMQKAISMMSSLLVKKSKVSFSFDDKGRVTCSGEAKTKIEKYMKEIIDNKDITVNLTVQESNEDENGYEIIGGSFDGNKFKDEAHTQINAYQTVDLISANENDLKAGKSWQGQTIWHEISEAFEGGLISINSSKEASKAFRGETNLIYDQAHKNASNIFPASPKPIYREYQIGWNIYKEIERYEFE